MNTAGREFFRCNRSGADAGNSQRRILRTKAKLGEIVPPTRPSKRVIHAAMRALVLCCLIAVPAVAAPTSPAEQPVDFVRDVQPILSEHCLKCHGPEKQKSAYRLDVKKIAIEGGESSAPNIVPGKSADSPLIHYVAGLDADMVMPPKKGDGKRLTSAEIGILRRWIDDGAGWPETASAKVQDPLDWWSLKPLVAGKGSIDDFIRAKLAGYGLDDVAAKPTDARCAAGCISTLPACRRRRKNLRHTSPISPPTNTSASSIACSPRRATANAGRGTGSMSSTTATRTATTRTSRDRTPGRIATT